MLSFLPGPIVAILSILLYTITVIILGLCLFIVMLIWLITPIPSWRRKIYSFIFKLPSVWSETIRFTIWLMTKTKCEITGDTDLSKMHSYLLVSNHQSLLDILILQKVLDQHVPQLRYFMKTELLWIPLFGQTCWLLGYPFMKRHSKAYIKKHPEKRNQDIETTRKTCERYSGMPITLISYIEGTRCTEKKRQRQRSPYKHLLKPKAGGIAFILSAMDKQINTLLNVTVVYSPSKNIDWTFLQGRMKKVTVHIEQIAIPSDIRGDYQHDRDFRVHFQAWLNHLWTEKDQLIENETSA